MFFIFDETQNTGKALIKADGKNTSELSEAALFHTELEAETFAKSLNSESVWWNIKPDTLPAQATHEVLDDLKSWLNTFEDEDEDFWDKYQAFLSAYESGSYSQEQYDFLNFHYEQLLQGI